MQEIWKDITGYEGYYQVSNLGRIRSFSNSKKLDDGGIMALTDDGIGYKRVTLCKDGKQKKERVHRLVAQAFIENPNNDSIVNHKDENKANNHVENLEWCSKGYNTSYGSANESRSRKIKGVKRPTEIARKVADGHKKPVVQLTKDGNLVKRYDSAKAARQDGFNPSCIAACCKGKVKTHGGYVWRYERCGE